MTTLIELPALPAPINELWHVLLDLDERLTAPWSVIGGQMVLLHALEHGHVPPQISQDGDVIADIRADPTAITVIVAQLEEMGFALGGISADGLAHRYKRDAEPRPVVIDVLAPEGMGARANLLTSPHGSEAARWCTSCLGACPLRDPDRRPDLLHDLDRDERSVKGTNPTVTLRVRCVEGYGTMVGRASGRRKHDQADPERRHQHRPLRRPVPPDRPVALRAHPRLGRLRGARLRAGSCQPGRWSGASRAAVAEAPRLHKTAKAWCASPERMKLLENTLSPDEVDSAVYDAIYFTGGPAVMYDFPDSEGLQRITREIFERGAIVSSVCQGDCCEGR